MNILVIDTATESCSVALETAQGVLSRFEICPQEHSRKLLPMVQSVLEEAGVELTQLDLLAVGAGPGSFTGVRIAMGMIQGMALGTGLPIVKVSTLQALAQQAYHQQQKTNVVSLLDARMSEVYFGHYQSDDSGLMRLQGVEQVLPPESLASGALQDIHDYTCAGTGWMAYPALSESIRNDIEVTLPAAEAMLPMAKYEHQQGNLFEAGKIEPTYLRDKVTWKKLPGR